MKKIIYTLIVVLMLFSTSSQAASFPAWTDTFNGASQPMVGYGKGIYYAYWNELWLWDANNGFEYIGSVDGSIYSLYLKGTTLYVGGYFPEVYPSAGGTVSAINIAKVNISTDAWTAVGGNVGVVPQAIVVDNSNNIYVGSGNYTSTCLHFDQNLLKKWNGSSWSTVGNGLLTAGNDSPGVYALVTDGTNIFAGGHFIGGTNSSGMVYSYNIIKWNPGTSTWSAMGTGLTRGANMGIDCFGNSVTITNADSWVTQMAISGTNVFASGNFNAGGGIARFSTGGNTLAFGTLNDSLSPQSVGVGVAVLGTDVYVSGCFDSVSSVNANAVAKYSLTGGTWSALSTGLRLYNGSYYRGTGGKIYPNDNSIILSGDYDDAGGIYSYPARWQLSAD